MSIAIDKLLARMNESDGYSVVREALATTGLPVPNAITEWSLLELLAKWCGDASATIEELDNLLAHI